MYIFIFNIEVSICVLRLNFTWFSVLLFILSQYLLPLFSPSVVKTYQNELDVQLSDWTTQLDTGAPVDMYHQFKQLSLSYNLAVFLGVRVQDEPELFHEFSQLSTDHWHGVVSLPLHVRLPLWGRTGYGKALEAREKLIKIIKDRVSLDKKPEFLQCMCSNSRDHMTTETLYNHLLLFCCALIPKAVASVMCSVLESGGLWLEEWRQGGKKRDRLEDVIRETIRMFPPFVGGLRIATVDTTVGRYHVDAGTAVFHCLPQAHRDPAVFPDPDKFKPERWLPDGVNGSDRDKMYGFGTGPHGCLGQQMTWNMMLTTLDHFLSLFRLDHPASFPPTLKYLPVLRPNTPHLYNLAFL